MNDSVSRDYAKVKLRVPEFGGKELIPILLSTKLDLKAKSNDWFADLFSFLQLHIKYDIYCLYNLYLGMCSTICLLFVNCLCFVLLVMKRYGLKLHLLNAFSLLHYLRVLFIASLLQDTTFVILSGS